MTLKTLILVGFVLLSGCGEREDRWTYLEKKISTSSRTSDSKSGQIHELAWTKPEGWAVSLGDRMRDATFILIHEEEVAECSIVQLSGAGGDVGANIIRWMRQLKMVPMDKTDLRQFLSRQDSLYTADGKGGIAVDLTGILSGDMSSGKSIVGAIFPLEKSTVFIKMMGSRSALKANKPKFLDLCGSIKVVK